MMIRPKTHLLVPLLALGLTVGVIATAHADDRYSTRSSGTSASIQINFGSSPRWTNVPGTPVRRIHEGDRTDYDIFRYGHSYYAYNNANNHWYTSQRYRGRYSMISDRSVPWQIRRLPRQNWRNYPTAWDDRNYRGPNGSYATMHVGFTGRPRWSNVNGTRVEAIYGSDRPNYDVFRYGGSYYAYNNDRWYSSPWERGEYTVIEDRAVPRELSRVPRDQWRNYPSAWDDRYDRYDRYDQRSSSASATLSVSFGSSPRWTGISGTRVDEVYGSQRPGYDVFRYGGSYYAYDNDQWYRSSRESGEFTMITDRDVPNDFRSIPRDHWRNYPQRWQDEDNDSRSRDSNQRDSRDGNDRWGNGNGGN